MQKVKFVWTFVLLVLLLGAELGTVVAQAPLLPQQRAGDGIQPTGWWSQHLASRWETPWEGGRWHKLAVWTATQCYGQEYLGPGGYQDTCSSPHGCIDQWTWWLLYPESKLGVPLSWWLAPLKPGRRTISNYRATCWID